MKPAPIPPAIYFSINGLRIVLLVGHPCRPDTPEDIHAVQTMLGAQVEETIQETIWKTAVGAMY